MGEVIEFDATLDAAGNFTAKYITAGPPNPTLAVQGVLTGTGLDPSARPLLAIAAGAQ
jgi:hypothetical protein